MKGYLNTEGETPSTPLCLRRPSGGHCVGLNASGGHCVELKGLFCSQYAYFIHVFRPHSEIFGRDNSFVTVYSDCILFNRRINIITQNSTEKRKINIRTIKLTIYTLYVTKTRKTLGLRLLLKQLV